VSNQTVLDVPVEFGNVSVGKGTITLNCKIARDYCNINAADDLFVGHRLSGRVMLGRAGDQPGQTTYVDDLNHYIDAVFDVKRMGVTPAHISTGLVFSRKDVDTDGVCQMSSCPGRLIVNEVAEIPHDAKDDSSDAGDDEPDGSLKAEGPWANVSLSTLFEGSLLKKLNAWKLFTVGDMANFSANPDNRLIDIEGVGPGLAERIENRMLQFFGDNPGSGQQSTDPVVTESGPDNPDSDQQNESEVDTEGAAAT
jgi:hypothetical protein